MTTLSDKAPTTPPQAARPGLIQAVRRLGWGVADACPGPIATQVGQGIAWSLFTATGVVFGVWLFMRRGARETEPATDKLPAKAAAAIP